MSVSWNPNDKHSSIVLSNDNLTVNGGSTTYYKGVKAKDSNIPLEKYYFEVTVESVGTRALIGIADSSVITSSSYAGSLSLIPEGVKGLLNTGIIYSGATAINDGVYTTGDIIGIAFDKTIGSLSFYKNGIFKYTLTGLNKNIEWKPYVIAYSSTTTLTASFYSDTFKYPIPIGFSPYGFVPVIKKFLFLKSNIFYGYDGTQWVSLTSRPSTTNIMDYGLNSIDNNKIIKFENQYESKNWECVTWTDGNALKNIILNATPTPQKLTAKNSIQIKGIESATFKWNATGEARVALSVNDGVSYHAFKNGAWIDVTNDMSNAMTASEYTAMTWGEFELLKGDSNFLKHQYSIPDNSSVDDILITAELIGSNKIANTSDYNVSYDQLNKQIKIRINKSGTYFANYVD